MLTFLGGGRGCADALTRPSTRHLQPKNFEKTALRKRVGIFTVKMRGGIFTEITVHICTLLRINAPVSLLSHPPFNLTILLYYYITAYMYVVRYSVNLTREQCGGSDRRLTRA